MTGDKPQERIGRIQRLAQNKRTRKALASFVSQQRELLETIIAVQQIPSPTFAEAQRACFVEQHFLQLGLVDVYQDALHNVYGRYPGTDPDNHRSVVISAHSDTVFPIGTDLSTRLDSQRLYGPGVGDNSTGVAGLFAIAHALRSCSIYPAADLWFVSNVGEEGLGDLKGMRAVVNRFGRQASYIVVEGGLFGQIAHEAIGVKRFRIDVSGPGGHSWGSFGAASAIHELGHLITAIDRMNVSQKPKSTYNIGVVEGGTTVNTIASSASLLLDLRSESATELDAMIGQLMQIIQQARQKAQRRKSGIWIEVTKVGDRPAGRIPRENPLVGWAEDALKLAGCDSVLYVSGSTDANIPLSLGIPAVCIGLTESANSHRLDEYIEIAPLASGLQQLLLLVLAAGDYVDTS